MTNIPSDLFIAASEWRTIMPELVILGFAFFLLIVDAIGDKTRPSLPWIAAIGLLAALGTDYALYRSTGGTATLGFHSMAISDNFSLMMKGIILLGAFLVVMASVGYLRREELDHGEYYALMLLSVFGMMLLVGSHDLIMVFLSVETLSISLYILSAFARTRPKSEEAGMKYLLLGAFAAAFLLYGIALIYGSTGTTNFALIPEALANVSLRTDVMLLAGIGLLLVGLGFKVSAVPFQVWTPDVYEGAPSPITAFMSVGTKVAAFAALARLFVGVLPTVRSEWLPILWALAALSMTAGNLIAIAQTNVKRMLAYSSIAHAGYILVGIAASNNSGISAVVFYLLAYAFMNIGAFAVVIAVSRKDERDLSLQDYAGLSRTNPWLARAMGLFMFGLAGIPPTAGFTSKFYVFFAALQSNLVGLVVVGVVTTIVSVYFYLRLTVIMFMNEPAPEGRRVSVHPALAAVIVVAAIGTLVLGVYPAFFFSLVQRVAPLGF